MANDWIKMRVDLQTHPKVFRIMSALNADVLSAWCPRGVRQVPRDRRFARSLRLFDAHSEKRRFWSDIQQKSLIRMLGIPGFSHAMASAGLVNLKTKTVQSKCPILIHIMEDQRREGEGNG